MPRSAEEAAAEEAERIARKTSAASPSPTTTTITGHETCIEDLRSVLVGARCLTTNCILERVEEMREDAIDSAATRRAYQALFGAPPDSPDAMADPSFRVRIKKLLMYNLLTRLHEDFSRVPETCGTDSEERRLRACITCFLKLMIKQVALQIKGLQQEQEDEN